MLDLICIAVFTISILISMQKGLIKMVYNFLNLFVAFLITDRLYPHVSVLLREHTELHRMIMKKIAENLSIREAVEKGGQTAISNLPLPENIIEELIKGNESRIHQALGVLNLEEYIAAFLANAVTNLFSMILVFVITCIIMRILAMVFNIVARLPVIKSFNKAGGAVVGAIGGFIAVWAIINIYCALYVSGSDSGNIINDSFVGHFFYENGLILRGFTSVFV